MPKDASARSIQPLPSGGRRFEDTRRVRLDEVGPDGQLRLDATARYLQDIATDDYIDAGFGEGQAWVLRRALICVERSAAFNETLKLTTWCSGIGSRYAERSTRLRGERGAVIDAASLWVYLNAETGIPRRLEPAFANIFGYSASGRRIGASLAHPAPPQNVKKRKWAPLYCDLDLWNHVNNARYWTVVLQDPAASNLDAPCRAEMEHRAPLDGHSEVEILSCDIGHDGIATWFVCKGEICASATINLL